MTTQKSNQVRSEKKGNSTAKTVILVSLVWIVIGGLVVAWLQNSQAQYNRGIFDGMEKTKAILQAK